jgi:hypothetical protein
MYCIALGLNAVHIGLPERAPVHAANLVHWLVVVRRVIDVHSVLEPAHAIAFIGAIWLDGHARDKDCGLGALWRAAGGENKGNNGENECFFHVDMG